MKMKTLKTNSRTRRPINRLAASDAAREQNSRLRLKVIAVPIDFSPESKKALRYACRLAEQFGSVLRLIHVVEPAPFLNDLPNVIVSRSDDEIAKEALVKLQALAQDEIDELIPIYPQVRVGKPYHEIVSAAKVGGADLIVISTHGYTGLKHAFLGSTAERVVRHAQCPVLVVRDNEHEAAS
jgi:nucleotide-binding universal stress UspA family protein